MSPSMSPSNTRSANPWTYAFTGALLAAAVIVAVFLLFGGTSKTPGADPDPAGNPTKTAATQEPTQEPSATSSPEPSETTVDPGTEAVTPVYYVGDTRGGPRLFREFQRAQGADEFARALSLLQSAPLDPDYLKLWPEGSLTEASYDGEVIRVSIADASVANPSDVDEARGRAAIESVIYTLQAAAQKRAPVQFMLDGNPVAEVYGVPTSEPLANGRILEVLNLMSVTEPEQGATVGDTMKISGVANSFEANVSWQIIADDGSVVKQSFVTADGWQGEQLFPWSDTIDVSKLAPGDYVFVAATDDPSGGAEGNGPATDSKAFTIS